MTTAKPDRNAAIAAAYHAGVTQRAIAEHFGIDQARVCRIIKRQHQDRPRGRPRLPAHLDNPDYVKLRRYLGAAAARDAMRPTW